jgi:methionine-rich copper-binding protein CopC
MASRTALAALLLIGNVATASARPMLDHASPAVGSTIRYPPSEISLRFTDALLRSRSDVVVRNATGGVVSTGKARVFGKREIKVPVKRLSAGTYRVEWLAASVDRITNQGHFNFTVGSDASKIGQQRALKKKRRPRS